MNRIASKQGLRKKFNNHQMVEHVKHVKNFWERDETYHVLNTKNLIFFEKDNDKTDSMNRR